jgi:4-amino-4-deoxy-L-arabinose transferase-like glycosyltransferase
VYVLRAFPAALSVPVRPLAARSVSDRVEEKISGWPRVAERVGSAMLVLAGLRYMLWYFNRGANLLDEGSQVAQASRILHGDLIYRDFITVVTPGSYYTVVWLFRAFGADLMVLRWAIVALAIGILLATMAVARHLVSWPFAAASAMLAIVWAWFLVTPNLYSWQAMFFALTALLCYLRYARTSNLRWLLGAGVAVGAAILVKQNTGVYAAVALFLTIWLSQVFEQNQRHGRSHRVRAGMFLTAGICAAVVPAVALLILAGAGPYLYENWFYYPQAVYPKGLSLPYPPFYPLLPAPHLQTLSDVVPALVAGRIPEPSVYEVWITFVLYLPLLVYPFAAVALGVLMVRWYRTRNMDAAREGHVLLAIALFGAFTFLQAWPRSDVSHILFGMAPAFILLGYLSFCVRRGLAYVLARWRNTIALRRRSAIGSGPVVLRFVVGVILTAVTLLPQAALLWNGYKRTDFTYINYNAPLHVERARGIFTSPEDAQQIDQVTEYITTHTAPHEPIFVVPWAAGFYFLADRPNPTRFDLLLYEDPEAYPCLIATLDRSRPKYVIYGYVWDVDGKHFSDYARPVADYIRTRYRVEATVLGYEIWRRVEGDASAYGNEPDRCRGKAFNWRSYERSLGASLRRLFGSS